MPKTSSKPLWLPHQQSEDCINARAYLSLGFAPAKAAGLSKKLAKAKVVIHAAKDIVRAAKIMPLPAANKRVAHDLNKIAKGRKLPPILLVRGDAARDLPLIVADGMHRLSAAWHSDESADVACCLVDRPKG